MVPEPSPVSQDSSQNELPKIYLAAPSEEPRVQLAQRCFFEVNYAIERKAQFNEIRQKKSNKCSRHVLQKSDRASVKMLGKPGP